MNAVEVLSAQFQWLHDRFAQTVQHTRDADMDRRPSPEVNSMGFLLWHILRIWDSYLSFVDGMDDLYLSVAAVLTHIQAHAYIHLGEAYCVRGLAAGEQ